MQNGRQVGSSPYPSQGDRCFLWQDWRGCCGRPAERRPFIFAQSRLVLQLRLSCSTLTPAQQIFGYVIFQRHMNPPSRLELIRHRFGQINSPKPPRLPERSLVMPSLIPQSRLLSRPLPAPPGRFPTAIAPLLRGPLVQTM